MDCNVGTVDRIVRLTLGVLLLAGGAYLGGPAAVVMAALALVPLATGAVGVCPAYSLLGVDTCDRPAERRPATGPGTGD